jgi:hypothetical protein
MQAQLDDVKAQLDAVMLPRLRLCAGNLLINMGNLVLDKAKANDKAKAKTKAKAKAKAKANDKASTHRLQQSLQSVETEQLVAAGIPPKFLPYLKNISKVYYCFLGSPWL